MSEEIKIAVVICDEKPNAEKGGKNAVPIFLTQDSSATLMPVLLKNHLMDGSFCGQRGECGRCVVQFLEGAPLPTGLERARLSPEKLRQGYRLACVARPRRDCTVRIEGGRDTKAPIVTEVNLPSEKIDLIGRQKTLSVNRKSAAMESGAGRGNDRYVVAADLGTTTIAMQLRDMASGETADTYCERNPQRIYGTDVLARIEASCNGSREELRRLVCGSLARGLRQFAAYLQKKQEAEGSAGRSGLPAGDKTEEGPGIVCMCVAGNTTMEHLLMGYDVLSLGRAPFVPVETGLQKISAAVLFAGEAADPAEVVTPDFPVYIAPCVSAFVGGDIVAGLYALRMLPGIPGQEKCRDEAADAEPKDGGEAAAPDAEEKGKKQGGNAQTTLLIDLGTNGEMAVTDGQRMIVTATAAGPAFEGNGDIIGTDRIALTAELLRRGALDETGLLAEPYFEEGVRIEAGGKIGTAEERDGGSRERADKKGNECYFYKEDVRALQMAKAAVRAGAEILWEEMGRPETGRIYLAGGFGYYLDAEAALAIGLLPSYMRGRVRAVGNTSLAGAYELGRDLYEGKMKKETLEKSLSDVESINLAGRENFERFYLKYMNFGEN